MDFKFAIIGGGLTATAMLCHLVKRVQEEVEKGALNASKIAVQVFEKQDVFGPGFPHNERFALPFHVTNMCARDMGILDNKPDDFQIWVISNVENLRNHFSWFPGSFSRLGLEREGCNHYPRAIMGEYLRARFQDFIQKARVVGLDVKLYPKSEVVDLTETADGLRLTVKALSSKGCFSCHADLVLLATGHWPRRNDQDQYLASPWPAKKLLRDIPMGEEVAVIGTSLSAIETVLTLTCEGEFIRSREGKLRYLPPEHSRRLVLYSRSGLLPTVRGRIGNRRNEFLNRKNLERLLAEKHDSLELKEVFELLNSELEVAYGRKIDWEAILNPKGQPAELLQGYLDEGVNGDGLHGELIWQTVLHRGLSIVRDVYLNLKLEERRRFDERYSSLFFTRAAPQPAINAEKLLALMRAHIVDVIKLGADYQLVRNDQAGTYAFIYKDIRGNPKNDTYRYVVDARGQPKSLGTNSSALAVHLLKSETVLIDPFTQVEKRSCSSEDLAPQMQTGGDTHKTGSVLIDPVTHHIMQKGPHNTLAPSKSIYAVGAMTRGQIIDASMARGIVQSTTKVADDLVEHLVRIQNRSK